MSIRRLIVGPIVLAAAAAIGACAPPARTLSAEAQEGSEPRSALEGRPLYSQGNEELIIRDFFGDRINGFFVDVGAAWPITYSNTYYLEGHLGWSGVAVDALPEYGPSWLESRPRSRFYSYFVTDRDDAVETFYRSELTGVSSSSRKQAQGPSGGASYEEMLVPSITLSRLLEENGVSRVDFLSMDIEGAELTALAGFDIERFRPELVCIEAKPENRRGILEYFEAHGYERLERYSEHDRTNYYFAPNEPAAVAGGGPPAVPPLRSRGAPSVVARAALALMVSTILPGLLLVGTLKLGAGPLERWVFAAVLGGPLAGAIYWLSLVTGSPLLYGALLGLAGLGALYVFRRDRALLGAGGFGRAKPLAGLLLLLSAVGGAYLFTEGHYYKLDSRGSFVMDPAFTEEALYHAAIVEGLQTSFPTPLVPVSGARVLPSGAGYHLQVAAWQRFFGVDRYDGICRVGILWWLSLLIFSAFLFGLRFSRSPAVALASTALLFGGGLAFLFHQAPSVSFWSLVFMDAAVVSILLIDPLLPALSLFFVGLVLFDEYLERSHRGALAASVLSLLALFSMKALLAVQIVGAIVLASALARGAAAARARRAALAFTLASAPVLAIGALALRESDEGIDVRPLEFLRHFSETIGRLEWAGAMEALSEGAGNAWSLGLAILVTVLWLAGFLGLRLLGAAGVVRDAVSRSGSVRSALSLFVVIGFPMTLLLRLGPEDSAGVLNPPALNQALWFASFSGMAAWLWTAEALAKGARGGWKSRAAAIAAASLLAFPSAVQHFVYETSLAVEAVSFPPSEVAAASASRELSGTEEVFLEPPGRTRPSLAASLAGRPVVYDSYVALRDRRIPREELEYRRHAVEQFWSSTDPGYGSWFLSHFNVRWIYNPRDLPSPVAGARWASPAFANDAATIYRVRSLADVPLRIPERLPLTRQGAVFFGPGWGPPESRPRLRRLFPGLAVLYLPTNEARPLHIELFLGKPHAAGWLRLGAHRVEVDADGERIELILPAREAQRGLSRIETFWEGADPLPVIDIHLCEDLT